MPHASSSALNERIEHLERQLASQRRHLARRTRFTAIVAVLLLIVLAGYFYVGYKNFDEVTRPQMVVQVAETFIDSNLPELRKSLQAEIIRSAPGWAEQASKELQSGMPRGREQLEDYIENQMDSMLDQASAFSQDQFRTFLRENRPVLERGFQDLAVSPTLAEHTMNEVMDGLDKQLSKQMQLESAQLFETLSMMKNKLLLLKNAQNLNNEQQLERRVLTLTRRLHLETPALAAGQTDQTKAAIIPVSATTGSAVPVEEATPDASKPTGDADEDKERQKETTPESKESAVSPATESAKESESE